MAILENIAENGFRKLSKLITQTQKSSIINFVKKQLGKSLNFAYTKVFDTVLKVFE